MATGLKEQNLLVLHVVEVLDHAFHVETLGCFVVVSEVCEFVASCFDDVVMQRPGWVWYIGL